MTSREPTGTTLDYASSPRRRDGWYYAALISGIISLIASACISTAAVFDAVASIRWQRAENMNQLALLIVFCPALLIQLCVFLPLVLVCGAQMRKHGVSPIARRLMVILTAATAVVTLLAIVIGLSNSGMPNA